MFFEFNSKEDNAPPPPPLTPKILCQDNNDDNDIIISAFMFAPSHLPYLATHIYPFWKKDFLQPPPPPSSSSASASSAYNPYASWSPQDIVRHNMGCKDNTLCVQLLVCDIPVAFCTVLLLDQFDYTDKLSPFSHEIYRNSAVLYNFVVDGPFRQQGYGSKMLQTVISHLTTTTQLYQYQYLILYVDKINTRAQHLYQQAGFTCLGDNPNNPATQDLYHLFLHF